MKTQTIVLALALVAVTPAVLSAQDYVGGPGSKMSYIADNALARIRENNRETKQQNPVTQTQTPAPQQEKTAQTSKQEVYSYAYTGREGHMAALGFLFTKPKSTPTTQTPQQPQQPQQQAKQVKQDDTTPAYYVYSGREGHAMLAGETLFSSLSARRQERKTKQQEQQVKTTDTVPVNNTTQKTRSDYNPYVGPEGHRAAIGNAVRDARHDSTPAATPAYVRDLDTVARNHQVTLDSKRAEKSTRNTHSTFRQYLEIVGKAIADEAPYMK